MAPITTGGNNSNSFTVPAGKDLYVPITGSDPGQTITYSATSSNSSAVATVMPSSNPTLTLNVSGVTGANNTPFSGAMTFELFANLAPNTVANIVNLVDDGEYTNNPAEFYRILTDAPDQVIQGGILYAGSTATAPSSIADEYNSALTYNSPGLLGLANAGPDTGSSEIFILAPGVASSAEANSSWNFQYSIFGQLTSGFDIYNDVLNTQITTNPQSGEDSSPVTPITITGASIDPTSTQAGVVQISELSDFAGTATVTVTGTGSDGTTAQQTFTVTSEVPSASLVSSADPLVLTSQAPNSSTTLSTAENTAISLPVAANVQSALSGGTYTFSVLPAGPTFGDPPFVSSTGNANVGVTVTPNSNGTATLTLTPGSNFTGTLNLVAEVDYSVMVNGQTVAARRLAVYAYGQSLLSRRRCSVRRRRSARPRPPTRRRRLQSPTATTPPRLMRLPLVLGTSQSAMDRPWRR